MNLTPKSWNLQSEITADNARVGDIVSYSDIENYIKYKIIDRDQTSMTIQNVKEPEYVDIKTFEQLGIRWVFVKRNGEGTFKNGDIWLGGTNVDEPGETWYDATDSNGEEYDTQEMPTRYTLFTIIQFDGLWTAEGVKAHFSK